MKVLVSELPSKQEDCLFSTRVCAYIRACKFEDRIIQCDISKCEKICTVDGITPKEKSLVDNNKQWIGDTYGSRI